MQGVPFILSLAYREQIDEACKPLINLGLKHFVMYLIFNDGSTFALSNVYSILRPYYQEGLYKEDFTYTQSLLTCKEGYYFCRQAGSLSEGLRTMLADKYAIFPIYNLVAYFVLFDRKLRNSFDH